MRAFPAEPPARRAAALLRELNYHLKRFELSADVADLTRAVEAGEGALRRTRPLDADYPMTLAYYCAALERRAEHTRSLSDVDRAIQAGDAYLQSVSPSSPEWAMAVQVFSAQLLQLRFTLTNDDNDLDASIDAGTRAFAAAPPTDEVGLAVTLADNLVTRSVRSAAPEDARTAVRLLGELVARRDPGDPARGHLMLRCAEILADLYDRYGELADARLGVECSLRARDAAHGDADVVHRSLLRACSLAGDAGERSGDADLVDTAVRCGANLVASLTDEAEMLPASLYHYGNALWARYRAAAARADLDAAITVGQRLVGLPTDDPRARATALYELASRRQARYAAEPDDADIEEAIRLLREAVDAFPDGDSGRSAARYALGFALRTRYQASGHAADLDAAIAVVESLLQATPPNSPDIGRYVRLLQALVRDRGDPTAEGDAADSHYETNDEPSAAALTAMAIGFTRSFEQTGDPRYLDGAVSLFRQALAAPGLTDSNRPLGLANLANTVRLRYAVSGSPDDIDEAARSIEEALAHLPEDPEQQSGVLLNGVHVYADRFGQTGQIADLEAAIRLATLATEVGSAQSRTKASAALGGYLITRYEALGAVQDLQDAVEAQQAALSPWPAGAEPTIDPLSVLSKALRMRYENDGASRDLEQAVARGREALAAAQRYSASPLTMHNVRTSLALALIRQAERQRSVAHADEFIRILRDNVQAMGSYPAFVASAWGNLSNAYVTSYEYGHNPSDLDEAIHANDNAIARVPGTHSELSYFLSRGGQLLIRRFQERNDAADLDAAIELGRRAVAATSPDQPAAANSCYTLAAALDLRAEATGNVRDEQEAAERFTTMLELPSAPTARRIIGAQALGRLAARQRRWQDATTAYALAVDLVTQLGGQGRPHQDREYALGQAGDLASDAAACAVQTSVRDAVELWDSARGALIADALHTRDRALERLGREHPALAHRLVELYAALAATGDRAIRGTAQVGQRIAEAVDEIRRQPGWERFQRGLNLSDLEPLTSDARPVVVVTVSEIASHAFIITDTGTRHVPLPDLNDKDVKQRVVELYAAIEAAGAAATTSPLDSALSPILEWLGSTIVAPIFDDLARHKTFASPNPTLTWCLSGLLGLLPMQAALVPDGNGTDELVPAFTRATFSFTPSLRAALRARQEGGFGGAWEHRQDDVLVVSVPFVEGQKPLPGAEREASMLRELFGSRVLELGGRNATRAAVLDVLPDRRLAHFACHGLSNPLSPADSALVLSDYNRGPLTVRDIIRRNLPRGDLAYLSACSTANVGVAMSDQAMHLASAFHVAGYRAVIGTLWPIDDDAAVRMAHAVYNSVAHAGPAAAAQALRQACIYVHDKHPQARSVWATYVYYGE